MRITKPSIVKPCQLALAIIGTLLFLNSANAFEAYIDEWMPHSDVAYESVVSDFWAQNQPLRSKAEVVSEVKQRYQARVLKIRLNQSRTAYKVRVLLPNGKVKEVRVRATR